MKPITITEADKEKMRQEFLKELETARLSDGHFTFTRSFASRDALPEERATILYSAEAYIKMLLLVQKFDSEVGWHALVRKTSDRTWLIYDVLVYDQEVTGATVNTVYEGENSYPMFLQHLTQDQADHMFFHGHSHVNMAVFPSSTDMTHRANLMKASDPDKAWIFQIWNKKGEISSAIYDIPNNVMYETKDIDLSVVFDYGGTDNTYTNTSFIQAAQARVKKTVFTGTVINGGKKKEKEKQKKAAEDPYEDYDDLFDDGTAPYGRGYPYGRSYS